MREQLEGARLNMLALFRALDRLHLAQDGSPQLHELFELDADFAEALWVLDQPVGLYDCRAMTADTVASLLAIGEAVRELLRTLSEEEGWQLAACMKAVRASLVLADAYLQIPGRDPTAPAKAPTR
jgi:hypothetical protein